MTVRLGDLTDGIPPGVRAPGFDLDRQIEVPCAEIFNGPVPKISLLRLAGIAPECFQIRNVSDTQIAIPAARLAPAYQLVITSEVIEEPVMVDPEPTSYAPPEEISSFPKRPQPAATPFVESVVFPGEPPAPPQTKTIDEVPAPVVPEPAVELPVNPLPVAPEPIESPAQPMAAPVSRRKTFFPPIKARTAPIEPVAPVEPPPAAVEIPPPAPAAAPVTRATTIPQTRRPFSILPIFRRKEIEPEKPDIPAPPAPRTRVEIPKPKAPLTSPEPPVPPPAPEERSSEPAPEPLIPPPAGESLETTPFEAEPIEEDLVAELPQSEAVLVETEHLPMAGNKSPSEISDQDALQAIFMTEEFLAVDRVVELCGGLPGIKSCVLSHGSTVLASHNVPDSIDLVSLSAHAVEMLSGMRASSAKMGIGAVPAVTVHSDKGPITFFHQDDLCLLIMHKDRGFIPGVREKLQHVVEELSRANLPLPVSSARPALEKWK